MLFDLFNLIYPPSPGPRYPGGRPEDPGPAPTGSDLWVTTGTYEFVAVRSACGKCDAGLSRELSVAAVPGTTWRIAVSARCRGWRRHRHTAVVTEDHGGLRFGELRPG